MRKIIITGFIFSLFYVNLYSQYEFVGIASQVFYNRYYDRAVNLDFQITDPAAIAMGNAFVSVANSPGAILWNPAGLTQLHKIQASFLSQINFNGRNYDEAQNSGLKFLSTPKVMFSFPSIAGIIPVKIGSRYLTAGIMYHRIINSTSVFDETQYIYGGGRINEIKKWNDGVSMFAAALGCEIFPQMSVGMTFHHLFGSDKYDLRIKSPYADQQTFFHFIDEEEFSGNYFTFGLLLKPIKWISLGATLSSKWTYKVKEKSERFEASDFDLETGWQTFEIITGADELSVLDVKVPLSYQIGLSIHPISTLTIAGAYEVKDWTKANLYYDNTILDNTMGAVKSQRIGVEYRAGRRDLQVPIRFGYYTSDKPQKDQFFEGMYYGNQIERLFFTFGLGIEKAHSRFDVSYQQGTSKIGWWMSSADYYNQRMFYTNDTINQVLFAYTYRL